MDLRTIDGHVHIVGDGSSGSGCWLDLIRKATDWPQRGVKVARKT